MEGSCKDVQETVAVEEEGGKEVIVVEDEAEAAPATPAPKPPCPSPWVVEMLGRLQQSEQEQKCKRLAEWTEAEVRKQQWKR